MERMEGILKWTIVWSTFRSSEWGGVGGELWWEEAKGGIGIKGPFLLSNKEHKETDGSNEARCNLENNPVDEILNKCHFMLINYKF